MAFVGRPVMLPRPHTQGASPRRHHRHWGLIALFIVGALMVRLVPFLAALINDLLDICNKLPNGVFGGNQIY